MERRITRGTKIVLQAVHDEDVLKNPLFAINWFNTRSLWLYNLYNMIASRSLSKIGGRVLFKGRVMETLLGSPEDTREILLIVNYPSGERFLDLLSNRFFQITSLLRLAAVRDFSFVFNQRVDGPALLEKRNQVFDASRAWAVHLYSSDCDVHEEVQLLRTVAAKDKLTLHFASLRAVIVHSEDNDGKRKAFNHVTDRVVILEAENEERIRAAVSGSYHEFAASVSGSYIGLLSRMM
jgi:uncharacterized protein (DUF1330 family)